MSFEPDTNDIRIRQLKEEIAKIREEQFARAFPTNNVSSPSIINSSSGIPAPAIGVSSIIPAVIRISKDTGVIDLLNFDGKNPNKDFTIGETITGQGSGATAEVGDIDTLTSTSGVLTLVPSTIVGTFNDNENLNGSGAGGTNIADADGTLFTQTGRGHLNAGAGSIIADSDKISSPFEIHFIDNAQQDGQIIYLRAQDGQTIRVRRALTNDSTTGNLDLDESFDVVENALVFFQYQVASNASDTGGWVPLITDVSATAGGGSQFQFPILYPKENLGTLNGVIDLSLNQSDGHYKQITLDGDASLTFSNLPPSINGFKFYVLTIQDGVGGHVYTDLPDSVLFENVLLGQLQTAPNSQTLWQFSTADGGSNWHASVINPQGGGAGDNLGNHIATQDLDMATFNIFDLDVLRYANGIIPGSDGVIGFGVYGSAVENDTVLKWSIPRGIVGNPRFYEWQFDLVPAMQLRKDALNERWQLNLLGEGFVEDTSGISFTHQFPAPASSSITPESLELRYDNGFGTGQGGFHGFRVANPTNPQWEVREFVNRSNVNLDMITNNIFNIDQAQFDQSGGFDSVTDKDIRTLTGGAEGMVMNIPKITPFAGGFHIYFENSAETESEKEYSFEKGQLRMFRNQVSDTLGILFSNGGVIADLNTHIQFDGGVNSNAIDPQTLKFGAKDSGFTTIDMFELTGTEHNTTNAGGMKMFTDLNLQTQDLTNVDRIHFNSNDGIVGGNQTAIAGFGDDMQFNVPTVKKFSYRVNDEEVAEQKQGSFRMLSNSFVTNPSIITDGSFIIGLTSPSSPFIDGEFRLVDNSGSLDVEVFTGGGVVNLTTGGSGTSFIGFNADDDLRMNTFNITGVDVLRFQVDGGVIGFNTYGISADAGDFSMNFSVPQDRAYFFQNNLEAIALLDHTGLNLLANTSFADPILTARQITALTHTQGTSGLGDGSYRLVGGDVIFGSGGGLVNLTTLSAGGGDNLGNHIATQDLAMQNNLISSFAGWTSSFGHSMFLTSSNMTWNVDQSTDFYRWSFNNIPHMELSVSDLNVGNKQITNVSNPLNNLDAVNLQTLNLGLAGVDVSQWANFPAVNNVNMDSNTIINYIGFTAGVGQTFAVSPTNMTWTLNSPNFYDWRTGGISQMRLDQASLDLNFGGNPKQILGVADPLNALDAVNLQTLQAQAGGDASLWSTFDAIQNVDIAGFQLLNTVAINGIGNGGGLIWGSPNFGQTITGDTSGLELGTASGSGTIDFKYGGVLKQVFSSSTVVFDSFLSMAFNRIVSTGDPIASQDVATKNYVDSQVGGVNILPLNNTWTGINTFTGSIHSIISPQIVIGDQSTDDIFVFGGIATDFQPDSTASFRDLGTFSRSWGDLWAQEFHLGGASPLAGEFFGDVDMNFLRIINHDFPINPFDVANKQYVDNQVGGGLLSQNNVWTGSNTWTGGFSVNSSFIFIGDSQSDRVFNVADQDFSLTPRSNNDIDLGAPSSRWRDLYVDFVSIASPGLQVTGFSAFLNDVLVTSGGNLAVSGGGDIILTGSGDLFVQSPASGVFTGALLPQGLFFHSGSQLGFFGAGLDTRNTVNDVVATGDAFTNTLLLTGAHNQLLFALEDYGLINVV